MPNCAVPAGLTSLSVGGHLTPMPAVERQCRPARRDDDLQTPDARLRSISPDGARALKLRISSANRRTGAAMRTPEDAGDSDNAEILSKQAMVVFYDEDPSRASQTTR